MVLKNATTHFTTTWEPNKSVVFLKTTSSDTKKINQVRIPIKIRTSPWGIKYKSLKQVGKLSVDN